MTTVSPSPPSPTLPVATARPPAAPPATRSTRDDLRGVAAVLASERIKLSSVRTYKVIAGVTAVLGFLTAWAVATFVTDEVLTVGDVFTYSTTLTAALVAIAGILLFTSEAQHGTLAGVLVAQPARWVVVAAKATTAAALGLVAGAVGMATSVAGAVAGGLDIGDTSEMLLTTLWALLFTSLSGVLGLGVGIIVRHGSGAISGLLVWCYVVENLIIVFAPARVARFLPFDAGCRLLDLDSDLDSPEMIAAAFTRPQYALLFTGYTAIALAAGTVVFQRRDAS